MAHSLARQLLRSRLASARGGLAQAIYPSLSCHIAARLVRTFINSKRPSYPKPDVSGKRASIPRNVVVLEIASQLLAREFRPPPDKDLASAWRSFFNTCSDQKLPIGGYQAKIALDVWNKLKGLGLITPADAKVALQLVEQAIHPSPLADPFERAHLTRLRNETDDEAFEALAHELASFLGKSQTAPPDMSLVRRGLAGFTALLEAGPVMHEEDKDRFRMPPRLKGLIEVFDDVSLLGSKEVKAWIDARLAWELFQSKSVTSIQPVTDTIKNEGFEVVLDMSTVIYLLRGAFVGSHQSQAEQLTEAIFTWAQDTVGIQGARQDLTVNLELAFLHLEHAHSLEKAINYYDKMQNSGGEFDRFAIQIGIVEELLARAICETEQIGDTEELIVEAIIDNHPKGQIWSARTLAGLAQFYLNRRDFTSLKALLTEQLTWYNYGERQFVIDSLADFVLDVVEDLEIHPKTQKPEGIEACLWRTYDTLASAKARFSCETGLRYMRAFGTLQMPDEALTVFQEMCAAPFSYQHPDACAYITALECLSGLGRLAAVQAIYNQLKIDPRVDPSLPLFNALLYAFVRTDAGEFAIKFWFEALATPSGPDLVTLKGALAICEQDEYGRADPYSIWDAVPSLPGRDDCLPNLVVALVRQNQMDNAKKLVNETTDKETKIKLLAYYLDGMDETNKEEALSWARNEHGDEFEAVENFVRMDRISADLARELHWQQYFPQIAEARAP